MRSIFARHGVKAAMLASTALFGASAAIAQDIPADEPTQVDEIVVVGSQIRGAKVTAALPVTMVGEELIQATAATSGDELLRSIPQMGDVAFNSSYLPNSSNSARGDTGSVNLRNLGIGNTLVLLNGRRVVGHPTSQANEHLVPVLTYNTNAIPVSGLKRMEVLRDGAAAIYGADAVAGVVNTVLRDDMNNWTVSAQYGAAEGTDMWESNFSLYGGKDIFDGRGNVSLFFNYDHRDELSTLDQDYTASSDKRPLFAGTGYENISSLDGRSSLSPWGSFNVLTPGVRLPGASADLTNFSIQPQGINSSCALNLGDDLCLRSGTAVDRQLYADTAAQDLTVMPEVDRFNLFLTGRFQINDNIEAFGELGGYHAKTSARQASIGSLSSILLTVPKSNYYNPFGPITFADGTLNPNRLPGVTAPADGADLQLRNYRFDDMGPIQVDVTNKQYRVLGGLRGDWNGWNWETALLYSEASAEDLSDNIETSALFRQMSLSTPDAYNPFAGSNLANPSVGGTGANKAALDAIRTKMRRYTETSLALWDFKVSRADLFALPAGHVGIAAGVEARHETQLDDRDSRIDGTVTFTDPVTGAVYSDLVNSSPNPDTEGKRDVYSAYLEFALPLVSPEMNIPFVHNLEAQIAGRYEHYSDFGDIAKPKVAVAWDVADGLRFRGSWAQGFRAPNLEQVNASLVTRNNSSTDWIFCEALRRNGNIANMNECVGAQGSFNNARIRRNVAEQRAGNPDLKAEESETLSFGVVVQPDFTPANLGDFTLTIDWWNVKQEGMVGVFRGQNALTLDYLLRQQGSYNPNVVRAEASAQDKALFAAAGLDAAGEILYVMDRYDNLQPQEVQGIDLGLMWSLRGTKFGDFNANFNVSHLLKYYLDPSPQVKELMDAQAKGDIDPFISFSGSAGDLIRDGGRPEWKWSASATWRYDNVSVGAYTSYTGSVYQDTLKNNLGEAWTVDSLLTANLYGEYEFDEGLLHGTAVRIGVRNITDEQPPLASDGYLGTVHQPYGRYWYANIRKTF